MHKPCISICDNPQLFLTDPSPLASDPFMILSLLQVLMNMLQRNTHKPNKNQTPSNTYL